jgi:hypothetical protein
MKRAVSQRRFSEVKPSDLCYHCKEPSPVKMLPTFILNDSEVSDGHLGRTVRPTHRRPISGIAKKAITSSRLRTSRSKSDVRLSSRSPVRSTTQSIAKKQAKAVRSSMTLKARLNKVPDLHLEIERLLTLLTSHLSRCPALTQELKTLGGSRLLKEFQDFKRSPQGLYK